MSKEIRSLTGVRGIAAVYVTVFHFFVEFGMEKANEHSILNKNTFIYSILNHGYLSVDLFFILSAFVMTLSSKNLLVGKLSGTSYLNFVRKRFVRIYPSYLIILLFGFLVFDHAHRVPNFVISLTLLNLALGLSFIMPHLWSLSAEWITYLYYPFLIKISKYGSSYQWNYLIFILGIIVLYLVGAIHSREVFPEFMLGLYNGPSALLRCLGDYLLGISAYGIFSKSKFDFLVKNSVTWLFAGGILCSLLFAKMDLLTVSLFVPFILSLARDNNSLAIFMGSKVIYFLGEISYPLYLINSIIAAYLFPLQHSFSNHITSFNETCIFFLMFIFTSITVSYLFTILIERPIIICLNKVFIPIKQPEL
jgi:peptidoglycan/LPS O-acetylase OafA/YrhL